MKKRRILPGIYLLAIAVLTLSASALRAVALCTEYNISTGYFADKGAITVGNALIVFAVLLALSYLFVADRTKKYVATYESAATYIPSALVGVALISLIVELALLFPSVLERNVATVSATAFGSMGLGAVTVGALFISCLRTQRRDVTRAAYQIAAILFLGFYAGFLYFENPLPINVPSRIADIMAYLGAGVFFIYETRISLGRDMWRAYTAFGFIGAALCGYSSIPSIIAYFVKGEVISRSIQESILTLALCVFIIARLALSLSLFEDTDSETVLAIKAAKAAKAAEASKQDESDSDIADADDTDEDDNYTIELEDQEENRTGGGEI